MSIKQQEDGKYIFGYDLNVVPCKFCRSTDLKLYEVGGNTPDEHKKGPAEGGAICKWCLNKVHSTNLPPVPSMSILLDLWNEHNKK